MAQVTYIVCPLCAYNFPLEKKGTNALMKGKPLDKGVKGRMRFDKVPIGDGIFEDIREGGGRGSGYHRVSTRTLKEILDTNDPNYTDLIQQIYKQSLAMVNLIGQYPQQRNL